MKHYSYQSQLHKLWQKAVGLYERGQRGAASFFDRTEEDWLHTNGLTAQEIYDFVEDFVSGGEPDFVTFATITDVRRSFFIEKLGSKLNSNKIAPESLPAKTAEIEGIMWLPRIIEKAKAKLRGQLHPDTMYCCGGDRRFLKQHDIHPAEFLRVVAENMGNNPATVAWVKARIHSGS